MAKKSSKHKKTTKAPSSNGRLLDLSTTDFDRPTVRIDGVDYEMRSSDEMSPRQYVRLIAVGRALTDLDASEEGSLQKCADLLEENVRLLMVDVPDDVVEKMTPGLVRKLNDFFVGRAVGSEAQSGADGTSSSAGASDTTAAA